jgi:hypothetical protein
MNFQVWKLREALEERFGCGAKAGRWRRVSPENFTPIRGKNCYAYWFQAAANSGSLIKEKPETWNS